MKILIVDDEKNILETLETALASLNYEITTTTNPRNALRLYRKSMNKDKYDVVITDIHMPGLSGLDLLKQLKERDFNARVILMTGMGDFATAKEAINNRAHGYLEKVFQFSELVKIFKNIEKEIALSNRP